LRHAQINPDTHVNKKNKNINLMESNKKKRMELDLSILLSTKNHPPRKEIDSYTHS
jgi:hypothetical protein